MAKKETPASDTPISVAPAGYKAPPAGNSQRAASSTQAPLKGNPDYHLQAQSTLGSTPSSDVAMDELSRWMFIERQELNRHLVTENNDDIGYRLLSQDDLVSKGNLSIQDIRAADTRIGLVAGTPAIEIKDDKGQSSYLVGNRLTEFLASNPGQVGRMSNIGEIQRNTFQTDFRTQGLNLDVSGSTLMNPRLAKVIRDNPTIAGYVQMTIDAAKRNGIDPIMLVNQFYQESRFNPNAVSPAGARGIAQMMPFQQGKFGLDSVADFFDPKQSIEAGAKMMANLTSKYGDQRLALIAYNGGGKAIDFVESKLGKNTVTFSEWSSFMTDRREKLGETNRSAWHVETLDYVRIIAGNTSTRPNQTVARLENSPFKAPEPA
jgi:hypothetical protein